MVDLVKQVVELVGSSAGAARATGIHERLFQRWRNGHARPNKSSEIKLRMFLDGGDDLNERERRICLYEERAALGVSLFKV